MKASELTVAVLIPVYRPDEKLDESFSMRSIQTPPGDQVIIMDTADPDGRGVFSSSESQEEESWSDKAEQKALAKGLNLEVYSVRKEEFDHAGTRSLGMEKVRTDVCVCMTQDAVPTDGRLVEMLIKGLCKKGPESEITGAAYARQLPQKDCGLVERYTRSFNYPSKSGVKTAADTERLGIKTYFCSNVCAAYNMAIYRRMGGFGLHEIFNEDMIYAARLIKAGYAVVYAAGARVIHSHDYTLAQQFHRNFDLAASQAMHPEIFSAVSSESEGIRLVRQTCAYLLREGKPVLIPGLIAQSGAKYLGYRLGLMYDKLPRRIVMAFTDNKDYWDQGSPAKD